MISFIKFNGQTVKRDEMLLHKTPPPFQKVTRRVPPLWEGQCRVWAPFATRHSRRLYLMVWTSLAGVRCVMALRLIAHCIIRVKQTIITSYWKPRVGDNLFATARLFSCTSYWLHGLNSYQFTLLWIVSRGDSQTTHTTILTDSMSLPQKVEWEAQTGMWQCSTPLSKNPVGVLSWTCRGVKENDWQSR